MILGIGIDIIEIKRLMDAINRHPDTFIKKVFTDTEITLSESKNDPHPYFAGRWAVKEAFVKALGCGIGPNCYWLDINVENNSDGKPQIDLSGRAAKFAESKGVKNIHISISHEKHYACAMVVLEA